MRFFFHRTKKNTKAKKEAALGAFARFGFFFAALVAAGGVQAFSQQSIKIGFSVVATDPAGQPALKAARMAASEINAAGGVMLRPLEIVAAYNATKDYSKVPGIINGMIEKGITCVMPSGGSTMTLKAAEVTIPKNVLMMSASSSSPKITDLKDNNLVWRTIPSDVFQGRLAAQLLDSLKRKTIGVIYVDNAYGNGLSKVFKEETEKRGGKVTAFVPYAEQQSYQNADFKPLLKTLFQNKPDAIYMITYGEDGARIINQAVEGKYLGGAHKPLIFGCDANRNTDFLNGVTTLPNVEGMTGLVYSHPQRYANYDKFFDAYKDYTPVQDSTDLANSSLASLLSLEETASYAATAYDAVYALAFAMAQAKSTEPKAVAAALPAISHATSGAEIINVNEFKKAVKLIGQGKTINYEGASGALEFDANGDVTSGSYAIWKIEKGNYVEVGNLNVSHKK